MFRCFVIVANRKIRSVITETYQYERPAIGLISSPPCDNKALPPRILPVPFVYFIDSNSSLTFHSIYQGFNLPFLGLEGTGPRSISDGRGRGDRESSNSYFFNNLWIQADKSIYILLKTNTILQSLPYGIRFT